MSENPSPVKAGSPLKGRIKSRKYYWISFPPWGEFKGVLYQAKYRVKKNII
jgi:hypothetical protein